MGISLEVKKMASNGLEISPIVVSDTNQLHCGACQSPMESSADLDLHLKSCPAARALLLPITSLMLGAADPSHQAGHLSRAASKYAGLIRTYAGAIANQTSSFERSRIHEHLCNRLGLEYSEFRPFESDSILQVPDQAEAERIIWDAIGQQLRKYLAGSE